MQRVAFLALLIVAMNLTAAAADDAWRPADGRLMTRWADDVSPDNALPEYPRPQMVRPDWANLNGLWEYAIRPRDTDRPGPFDGKLLVPFPVESALSGVMERVGQQKRLWYRRTFDLPETWNGQRVLLHFGAVDWETNVWVNEKLVGTHRGGYDPFTFDVTDALVEASTQRIVVAVWDPSDAGKQPRGKQVNQPRGIWYTPTTGIWQTVWLEPVPEASIGDLKIVPDVDSGELRLSVDVRGDSTGCTIKARARDGETLVAEASGQAEQTLALSIADAKLWSPDSPFLYDLEVELLLDGESVDRVESYFGMRKIALGRDDSGIQRLFLNNEPLFHFGPLDQGFWPDGLYTAPTDEALRYDLEMTKRLGFNMVRKHVKVEPARWYTWCDRLGLLVWQDMPSGDDHARWPRDGEEITRQPDSARQYLRELEALVTSHWNYPSIVMWVPFNEAWGQFDTVAITERVKRLDPTRLVNSACGGNDFDCGDVYSIHSYPGPLGAPLLRDRAVVLGEYGGLGLPLAGHTLLDEKNWGYRSFDSAEDLTEAYLQRAHQLRELAESRMAAAVYTQTTDVEIEINGLMTYDREITKMDVETVAEANRTLYQPMSPRTVRQKTIDSTVAFWRFEDGKAGDHTSNRKADRDTPAVRDASGNRNHLYAFGPNTAPRFSDDVPADRTPGVDLPNRLCLDDTLAPPDGSPTRDLFSSPWAYHTVVNADCYPFAQWTVEASFKLSELGRTHGIVGKDGSRDRSPQAPFQLRVLDDGTIEVAAVDDSGELRSVRSKAPIEANQWVHVAAVSDGETLRLLVNSSDNDGYVLQNESPFSGRLENLTGTWTLGRGWPSGSIGDDARAWIDEVRLSAAALEQRQLLFAR